VLWDDGSSLSPCEYHNDQDCCEHAGIATWHLGGGPPVLDVLSGGRVPLSPPSVAISGTTVTALWPAGYRYETGGGEEELTQAYGRFGGALRVSVIPPLQEQISDANLVESAGHVYASWLDGGAYSRFTLYTATAGRTGRLQVAAHRTSFAYRVLADPVGLIRDDVGDTLYVEERKRSEYAEELFFRTTRRGRPFSLPHAAGPVPSLRGLSVTAGGAGSVLATWESLSSKVYAQRGGFSGALGRPTFVATLNEGDFEGPRHTGSVDAFVDGNGRAIVIFDHAVRRHPAMWQVLAAVAEHNRRFSVPFAVTPELKECQLEGGFERDARGLDVQSPSGRYQLLVLPCADGRRYVIPYGA
jgi:hypothetical protein